jgi:uncharacterized protein YkwD
VRRPDQILTLFLVAALAGCVEATDTAPIDAHAARDVAAVQLDPVAATAMLNAYRASQGLGAVRLDPALNAMAQRQADAMVAANQISHDVAGSFTSRLAASGVVAKAMAENIGGGYYSLQDEMDAWRRSPAHNANLLMPDAKRFGIAIAKDPRAQYGVYWAMEMAAEPRARTAGYSWGFEVSPAGAAVEAQ